MTLAVRCLRLFFVSCGLAVFACRAASKEGEQAPSQSIVASAASADSSAQSANPHVSAITKSSGTGTGQGEGQGVASAATLSPSAVTVTSAACPEGMLLVPGGEFWAGRERPGGNDEEHPRYRSRVNDFCLDRTEVTAAAYEACAAQGKCSSALRTTKSCSAGRERPDHPINCVDWEQAQAFCAARGARLPTELEWEYAARGGAEYRRYSWGNDAPDGHTCWKTGGTCPVASHTVGAFGLHDMNGNVWEWTDTWFNPYPWPASNGSTKVYRGGSFSRRFEKWLSLTLRNRSAPDQWGSHLGFRCAALSNAPCPYGQEGDRCLHGVEMAECPAGQVWNGVRCARPGEVGCAADEQQVKGYGCVGATPAARTQKGAAKTPNDESDLGAVTARHDARFDADCARFNPTRPLSWLFEGGSHAARNQAGRRRGCKNRDVGVGWNSTCCP